VTLMSREPWTLQNATEAQARLLAKTVAAFKKIDAETEAAYELARQAKEAGVPMEVLAERTGRSRATLFRRVKPQAADKKEAP
jgi:lactam utilization protein B